MSPPGRPRVIVLAAMTADGKISSRERVPQGFGSREDKRHMARVRGRADVIMVGAGTLRSDDPPYLIRDENVVRERTLAGRPPLPAAAIVTGTLNIHRDLKVFRAEGRTVYIISTEQALQEKSPDLPENARTLAAGADEVDPHLVLERLADEGAGVVLLEGGGGLNGLFFGAGLVDEIYLTVCPFILGGRDAPTPVDGPGFSMDGRLPLRLLSCRETDGEVFLHYEVSGNSS